MEVQCRLVAATSLTSLLSWAAPAALECSSIVSSAYDRRCQPEPQLRSCTSSFQPAPAGTSRSSLGSRGLQPLSQQLRQGSRGASSSSSSSSACTRHGHTYSSRTFASQPAYAYDDVEPVEDHNSHHYDQGPAPALVLRRSAAALQAAPVLDVPPWDVLREVRVVRLMQYRRELFNVEQVSCYTWLPAALPPLRWGTSLVKFPAG